MKNLLKLIKSLKSSVINQYVKLLIELMNFQIMSWKNIKEKVFINLKQKIKK